jgi:hypothetical protein
MEKWIDNALIVRLGNPALTAELIEFGQAVNNL